MNEKLERKVVSEIMLTLLVIGMLTLAFNVRPVKAKTTYYDLTITVTPEYPTTEDEISVTVYLELPSTRYVAGSFPPEGFIHPHENKFDVTITMYTVPPDIIFLPVIVPHTFSYDLGKLPAGSYQFTLRLSGVIELGEIWSYSYVIAVESRPFTVREKLGVGYGCMCIEKWGEYVCGPAQLLYNIVDNQIELVITYQDEQYYRTWEIEDHSKKRRLETFKCYNPEWKNLKVM